VTEKLISAYAFLETHPSTEAVTKTNKVPHNLGTTWLNELTDKYSIVYDLTSKDRDTQTNNLIAPFSRSL